MEDEVILSMYFARDEGAVAETDKKYGRSLRSLSARITGTKEDAEECVNDTLLKAWESIPPDRPSHFYSYLAVITRNLSLNRLKAEGREKRGGKLQKVWDELEDCLPSQESVERTLTDRDAARIVGAYLEGCDRDTRYAFIQRYYLGQSVASIAVSMGRTAVSVSVLLHRARKKLKEELIKEGIEP